MGIAHAPTNYIEWCKFLQGEGLGNGDARSFRQSALANIAWSGWKDRYQLVFQNKAEVLTLLVERGLFLTKERFKLRATIIANEEDRALWSEWGFGYTKHWHRGEMFLQMESPGPNMAQIEF